MHTKSDNFCPCSYCKHYYQFEYKNEYFTVRKGYCEKHNSVRDPNDILCEDFILAEGIYTNKQYPKKQGPED